MAQGIAPPAIILTCDWTIVMDTSYSNVYVCFIEWQDNFPLWRRLHFHEF